MPPKKRASSRKRAASPKLDNLTDEIRQRMTPKAARRLAPAKRASSRTTTRGPAKRATSRVHSYKPWVATEVPVSDTCSISSIVKILFLVGCIAIAGYLVAPPGVAEYMEDAGNIMTMDEDYDGNWGSTEKEKEAYRAADPDYSVDDAKDTYEWIDLFAPKNNATVCAVFWKPCRDWHFVHGATAVLMILVVLWSVRVVSDGKIKNDVRRYQVRARGIWGMLNFTETKSVVIGAHVVEKRRSVLLAKLGTIIISIVAFWSSIDALFVMDFKGFAVAAVVGFFAWQLTKVNMQSSWNKTVY